MRIIVITGIFPASLSEKGDTEQTQNSYPIAFDAETARERMGRAEINSPIGQKYSVNNVNIKSASMQNSSNSEFLKL